MSNEAYTIKKIERETEKAILITTGYVISDKGEYMVLNGNSGYFRAVNIWVPKSMVKDNTIPMWLFLKNMSEQHFAAINFVSL